MQKFIIILILIIILLSFAGCGNTNENEDTTGTESNSESTAVMSEENGSDLSEPSSSAISIEDFTSEYVEPSFKVVFTLADSLDYFTAESGDTVEKENDSDGRVTSVTTVDSEGKTKGVVSVTYKDDSIASTAVLYENGEATGEKILFTFYNENSLNYAAHCKSDANISLYIYNSDHTVKYYIDGTGFATLLTSTVMSSFAG